MAKNYNFAKKANRDAFAKVKKSQGFQVRKTSIKNQLCDPRYMRDYEENMGSDYQTYFSTVFVLETDEADNSLAMQRAAIWEV